MPWYLYGESSTDTLSRPDFYMQKHKSSPLTPCQDSLRQSSVPHTLLFSSGSWFQTLWGFKLSVHVLLLGHFSYSSYPTILFCLLNFDSSLTNFFLQLSRFTTVCPSSPSYFSDDRDTYTYSHHREVSRQDYLSTPIFGMTSWNSGIFPSLSVLRDSFVGRWNHSPVFGLHDKSFPKTSLSSRGSKDLPRTPTETRRGKGHLRVKETSGGWFN